MAKTFDHLVIIGRPASGKSEFCDFMKKTPDAERAETYHIGRFEELDDFPWLWEKFVEDDMWEEAGYPRVFSDRNGKNYDVKEGKGCLYDFMFTKFNHAIASKYLARPEFYKDGTLFVEFSRGLEGGYKNAFSRLSKDVLSRAAILYLKVSFDESWRRNVARYEEKLRHSILAHMLPRPAMERFYLNEDWDKYTGNKDSGTISAHGLNIPFVTMNNEPELKPGPEIAKRYKTALNALFDLYGGEAR